MKNTFRRLVSALLAVLMCVSVLQGCSEKLPQLPELPEIENTANQIVISEVMSSNDISYPAPDGRYYDWVELHNRTDKAYDLSSCYLTDDERTPKKFRLNGLVIQPDSYAVVYLSGHNAVDENGSLHADFKLSSMGETLFLIDQTGVVMFALQVPESPSNVTYGFPDGTESYTDSDCAWFAVPTPCQANTTAHAADPSELTYPTNGVVINEYLTSNTFTLYDSDGEYSDWVELHNPTGEDASMRGYALADSDDASSSGKWSFPEDTVIPAGGYLVVFCSGKSVATDPAELHTSFRLSREDNAVALFDPSGRIAHSLAVHTMPDNVSCGLDPATGEAKLYASPTPGAANSSNPSSLDATALHGVPASAVLFTEVASVSSTRDETVRDYDYVELYNRSAQPVSLKGYGLSDSADEVKYIFPEVTLQPGEYLLVNCGSSGAAEIDGLVAPFGLRRSGETVYLTYPDGHVADLFSAGRQDVGVSRGRLTNDLSGWSYFTKATPGKENPSADAFRSYAPQPLFSFPGGTVEKGFELTITAGSADEIRYTTDGSRPTKESALYKNAIVIDKTTVVRAASFAEGLLPGEITTATYFVGTDHDIPIVSLSSDPDGLFSEETGIYSSGRGLLEGRDYNYRSDVERLTTFEYYVDGKKEVSFDAGLRIFGRGTRSSAQKSFAVMLREIYGAGSVDYPFFKDNPITEFSSLVLRQSGQEWRYSKLRDELCASIMKNHVKVDYMDMTPAALYINGEYWGLYYIREKQNEDYIRARYGYEGELDIVREQTMAVSGTMKNYSRLNAYVKSKDMTKKESYEGFCKLVDMDSYMDFWICQSFFGNNDTANMRCHYCPEDENSKWHWMIFDLDNAFYGFSLEQNPFARDMISTNGHGIGSTSSALLARRLSKNKYFREDFAKRFCYHLKTTFAAERTIPLLDELVAAIDSEIPKQCERWGSPTAETWEHHINMIRDFLTRREGFIVEHFKKSFGFSDKEFQKIYDAA